MDHLHNLRQETKISFWNLHNLNTTVKRIAHWERFMLVLFFFFCSSDFVFYSYSVFRLIFFFSDRYFILRKKSLLILFFFYMLNFYVCFAFNISFFFLSSPFQVGSCWFRIKKTNVKVANTNFYQMNVAQFVNSD